jgi:hypothetical protein
MDKSLLDLPDKPKEDIDTKADNHKSERKGDDDDEEYVPPVSPHSPGEKVWKALLFVCLCHVSRLIFHFGSCGGR